MRPRATHVFLLIDYAIGMFVVLALVALAGGFLLLTGPPKRYGAQELGVAYANTLSQIESSAHALHNEFCAKADRQTARDAKCPPSNGAAPDRSSSTSR